MSKTKSIIEKSHWGLRLDDEEVLALANDASLDELMRLAERLRDTGHAQQISYSPKAIIPLTKLCQNEWDYCNIANIKSSKDKVYLSPEEILSIAEHGKANGCQEILFFLSAKPEQWSGEAQKELAELGFSSTLEYLHSVVKKIAQKTGMLPKVHSGVLTRSELLKFKEVSVGQGLMIDSQADFHVDGNETSYGVAQAHPHVRLGVAAAAGAINVPFTSGIVVGMGESKEERLEALLSLRHMQDIYGHIQEVVVQDSRYGSFGARNRISKSLMKELLWTVSMARIIFGSEANVQAPGDLPKGVLDELIKAGINDWGSVSPPYGEDASNWNQIDILDEVTQASGKTLVQRKALYPEFIEKVEKWCDPQVIALLTDNNEKIAVNH